MSISLENQLRLVRDDLRQLSLNLAELKGYIEGFGERLSVREAGEFAKWRAERAVVENKPFYQNENKEWIQVMKDTDEMGIPTKKERRWL